MSKSDRPDREKIAEQFYGGYCELEDRTELDWQEALSNADQIIALFPDIEKIQKWYDKLLAEIKALKRERIGEVWYWQGDGEDKLESLTCPILIEPQELISLIEEAKKQRDEFWQDKITGLGEFSKVVLKRAEKQERERIYKLWQEDTNDGKLPTSLGFGQSLKEEK